MKTEKIIQVAKVFRVRYDENSPEFKEALTSYQDAINPEADALAMVKSACSFVARYGGERMIEGIGYVMENSTVWGEPYSGIEIDHYMEETEEY